MQIHKVQNQSFEAKQRFLPQDTHKQVKKLLNSMNSETVCQKTEWSFSSNVLSGLKIDSKDSRFYDGRCLVDKAKDYFIGESDLEMGKVKLSINNATGEITKYKKPFFKSWKSIYEQASEVVSYACRNFGEKEAVEKVFIGFSGFTEKGASVIENAKKTVEKVFNSKKILVSHKHKIFLEPLNGVF